MDEQLDDVFGGDEVPMPVGAAAPPRRPPTAVGAGEFGSEPPPQSRETHFSLTKFVEAIAKSLALPIEHAGVDVETQAVFREAGVRTVGDLLRLSDRRLRRLGVDARTRRYLVEVRRAMGVPTTGA